MAILNYKINENKMFEKYIRLYRKYIEQNDKKEEILNYQMLNENIRKYYKSFSEDKIRYENERLRLRCIIECCGKNDIISFVNMLLSVIIPSIILLLDKTIDKLDLFSIKSILKVCVGYCIYIMIIDFCNNKKNNNMLYYKSFHVLCLNILESIKINEKNSVELNENLYNVQVEDNGIIKKYEIKVKASE